MDLALVCCVGGLYEREEKMTYIEKLRTKTEEQLSLEIDRQRSTIVIAQRDLQLMLQVLKEMKEAEYDKK